MTDNHGAYIAGAEGLVTQALAASPRSATVHFVRDEVLRVQCRYDEAIPEYETVLAFDRNSVSGLVALGHSMLTTGSTEDVIPLMERAIRLSPRDPQIAVMNYRIGEVHLLRSRIDKAVASREKGRSANLELAYVRAFLPLPMRSGARSNAPLPGSPKLVVVLFEATYCAGLRKAGMPEE
jgi:hypothetical protein